MHFNVSASCIQAQLGATVVAVNEISGQMSAHTPIHHLTMNKTGKMCNTKDLFVCLKRQHSHGNTCTIAIWTRTKNRSQWHNSCAKSIDCGHPCSLFQLWTQSSQPEQTGPTGCSEFTDVTQHALAYWPLSAAANHFHFCSSPPKSAQKMGFTCKVIILRDNLLRDAWKANQWSSVTYRFPHPFLICASFFLLGYWI